MAQNMDGRTDGRTDGMTIPTHIAQTLKDLRERRDYLDQAIHVLSTIWEGQSPAQSPAPSATYVATPTTPQRQLPPTERRRKTRGGSDSDDAHSTTILNALRKTLRPVSVGELTKETKLSNYILNDRLKKLGAKRLVVITGKTNAKRIALPGTTPAKEEP